MAPLLPHDWWAIEDVLRYLRSEGSPIVRSTWAAYTSRGYTPAPDRKFGRSPVWRPNTIREWHARRPRIEHEPADVEGDS